MTSSTMGRALGGLEIDRDCLLEINVEGRGAVHGQVAAVDGLLLVVLFGENRTDE